MSRLALRTLHIAASALALLLIATFLSATVVAELGGDPGRIAQVKAGIFYGIFALAPVMATLGLSGWRLGRGTTHSLVRRKLARMRIIGANAALVLVPCAVVLHWLAASASFGTSFYLLQALELAAGSLNLTLLALNLRDGLVLRAARRRPTPEAQGPRVIGERVP
jgi:hypothetical protein